MTRPPLSDVVLAAVLMALGVLQVQLSGGSPAATAIVVAYTAPVVLRRAAPLVAVALSWLVLAVEGGLGEDVTSEGYATIVALCLVMYSVARHGRGPEARVGLVLGLALTWWSVLSTTGLDWASLALTSIVVVGPWLAGYVVRREQLGRRAAEDRTARVAAVASAKAEAAAAGERERIAREVHDVLGNTLGLMVLQLGAVDSALDRDPEAARRMLRTARSAGKDALVEVRYLVGLEGGASGATPGVRDIAALVDRMRTSGFQIDLTVEPPDLAPDGRADLAAYRIVQESLTNAVTHGTVPVRVAVIGVNGSLEVTVTNALAPQGGAIAGTDGGGKGLRGMAERVRACGGTFTAGKDDGHFVVRALLPLDTTAELPRTVDEAP